MKKLITAVLTTGLLLTGGVITAAPAAATAPSYTKKENNYVRAVRAGSDDLYYVSKRNLIDLGRESCRSLRVGVNLYDIIDIGIESGFSENDVTSLLAGAITYFCPDQEYKIESDSWI